MKSMMMLLTLPIIIWREWWYVKLVMGSISPSRRLKLKSREKWSCTTTKIRTTIILFEFIMMDVLFWDIVT